MTTRNQRLAATRLALHDLVCMSACTGERAEDHARRTMHSQARLLVDTADVTNLLNVVHGLVHPTCTLPHRPKLTHPQVIEIAEAAGIRIPEVTKP